MRARDAHVVAALRTRGRESALLGAPGGAKARPWAPTSAQRRRASCARARGSPPLRTSGRSRRTPWGLLARPWALFSAPGRPLARAGARLGAHLHISCAPWRPPAYFCAHAVRTYVRTACAREEMHRCSSSSHAAGAHRGHAKSFGTLIQDPPAPQGGGDPAGSRRGAESFPRFIQHPPGRPEEGGTAREARRWGGRARQSTPKGRTLARPCAPQKKRGGQYGRSASASGRSASALAAAFFSWARQGAPVGAPCRAKVRPTRRAAHITAARRSANGHCTEGARTAHQDRTSMTCH